MINRYVFLGCGVQLSLGHLVLLVRIAYDQLKVVLHQFKINVVVLVEIVDQVFDGPYHFEDYTSLTLMAKKAFPLSKSLPTFTSSVRCVILRAVWTISSWRHTRMMFLFLIFIFIDLRA